MSCNEDCHIILRGGKDPNYSAEHVDAITAQLAKAGHRQKVMIDFSHANSLKQYQRQMLVAEQGNNAIFGVMIESHLVEGRQDIIDGVEPTYGQSITDACIGWDDTEKALTQLAHDVKKRRVLK